LSSIAGISVALNWSLALRKDQTMKRKRHTEDQIIAILKEHEVGVKTADLCRKHGISEASFYNWKAKYGGLEVSAAKRLKGLESEPRSRGRGTTGTQRNADRRALEAGAQSHRPGRCIKSWRSAASHPPRATKRQHVTAVITAVRLNGDPRA
jgi:putative transposase